MGRRKKTVAPAEPKYQYIGPPGALYLPGRNLRIRAAGLTDVQIEALINEHPPLRQYFQQDRAGEEE